MCKKSLNILQQIMSAVIICIIMLSFTFSPYFLIKCFAIDTSAGRPQQTGSVEEDDPFLGFIQFTGECLYNLLMATGAVIGDVTEIDTLADICRSRLIETGVIIQDSDTNNYYIQETISADTLLELRNLIEQEMKSKEPCTVFYSNSSKRYYEDTNILGGRMPKDGSSYVALRSVLDQYGAVGFSNIYHPWVICIDFNEFYYAYKDGNSICFVDKDLKSVTPVVVFHKTDWLNFTGTADDFLALIDEYSNGGTSTDFGISFSAGSNTYNSRYSGIHGGISGKPITVFDSLSVLYDYVKGKPTAYYTSDYYNKTYQDITLNQETIKNYTTENIQNIYNTINNNADNALTQDELQKIIDSTVKEGLDNINSSLDDVNKGLDGVNESLGDIKQETKTANSWLEKIYDRLGDIYTLLVDGYMFEDEQETDDLFDTYMGVENYSEMITIFLYGMTAEQHSATESMVMLYDDISAGAVDDSDLYSISGYSYDFYAVNGSSHSHESGTAIRVGYGGIVGHMAHKFPFCLPFDLYDTVRLFVGEPETPHFVIPFHVEELDFDYEIVVDLSGFDMLSRLSRSLTTLLMVYGIIVFTKKNIIG